MLLASRGLLVRPDGVALGVPVMAIAALDLGARRIGIAISDAVSLSAYPLCTIARRSTNADVAAIQRALCSRVIECLVVGLPVNMNGSEGPMARHARNFGARIADAMKIPVKFQDERLSSFEAEHRLATAEVRRSAKKAAIDANAAAIILEDWLIVNRAPPCKI